MYFLSFPDQIIFLQFFKKEDASKIRTDKLFRLGPTSVFFYYLEKKLIRFLICRLHIVSTPSPSLERVGGKGVGG